MTTLATSSHTYWSIALIIGLAAALIVATLLILLIRSVRSIERSTDGLLEVATAVGENTAFIPQLEATAPVLAQIVDEAVVQDGYMNALTDGFGAEPAEAEEATA
jgi:predicted permease